MAKETSGAPNEVLRRLGETVHRCLNNFRSFFEELHFAFIINICLKLPLWTTVVEALSDHVELLLILFELGRLIHQLLQVVSLLKLSFGLGLFIIYDLLSGSLHLSFEIVVPHFLLLLVLFFIRDQVLFLFNEPLMFLDLLSKRG